MQHIKNKIKIQKHFVALYQLTHSLIEKYVFPAINQLRNAWFARRCTFTRSQWHHQLPAGAENTNQKQLFIYLGVLLELSETTNQALVTTEGADRGDAVNSIFIDRHISFFQWNASRVRPTSDHHKTSKKLNLKLSIEFVVGLIDE